MVLDEADRLLDMGFEQTIMEICAILRGSSEAASNTPGAPPAAGEVLLVPPEDPVRDAAKDSKDSKTPLKILDINQKWREQSLTQSKLCSSFNSLSYVMVSATLTSALKRISFPVMGSRGFTVVDAEKETSERVETLADLATLGRDTGRLDGKVGQSHRPDKAPTREERGDEHEDEDEDGFEVVREGEEGRAPAGAMGDKKSKAKKERSSDLAVNEQISTPSQLSQYFMMVTCKWRLAALLCFLKMHAHEKVMVFFATCDSVDYHALLMHNAKVRLNDFLLLACVRGQRTVMVSETTSCVTVAARAGRAAGDPVCLGRRGRRQEQGAAQREDGRVEPPGGQRGAPGPAGLKLQQHDPGGEHAGGSWC